MQCWMTRDYHVSGEPVRVFPDGYWNLPGSSMLEKRTALMTDERIQCTIREPRGHDGMYAAVFTAPVSSGSTLGVLFACNENCFPMFCGHALLGAVRAAAELGLVPNLRDGENRFLLDVPSGTVEAVVDMVQGEVRQVSFINQPCFVIARQVPVSENVWPVDVVWSGSFMAYVPAEILGEPISPAVIPRALELGYAIESALRAMSPGFVHPVHSEYKLQKSGALICFVTPVQADGADLRAETLNIIDRNNYDRGAAGTATCGRLALLWEQGIAAPGQTLYNYCLTGQHYDAALNTVTTVAGHGAIVPQLTANIYPMGESRFCLSDDDPFPHGFL